MSDSAKSQDSTVIKLKTLFKNTDIKTLYSVVSNISLLAEDSYVETQTDNKLILTREKVIAPAIANLIHCATNIPYMQYIDIELDKGRFLNQTTVKIREYVLTVGMLYRQSGTDCECSGRISVQGIKNKPLKRLAETLIKKEYHVCRNYEQKVLKKKSQIR